MKKAHRYLATAVLALALSGPLLPGLAIATSAATAPRVHAVNSASVYQGAPKSLAIKIGPPCPSGGPLDC
jgi:hypothetical protein